MASAGQPQQQQGVCMKRGRSQEACKRRLTWASLGGSQDSEDYKVADEEPSSPCGAAAGSPAAAVLGPIFSTPTAQVQALTVSDRAVVQSPIIDGALFLEGRRKARVLGRLNRPEAAAGGEQDAAQLLQQEGEEEAPAAEDTNAACQQEGGPQQLSQQADRVQQAAAAQCQAALSAAGSSSRGCLDLLCWGIALDQQQQAAGSPATPAAAGLVLLPGPPRKPSAIHRALPAGGVMAHACRAARVLPGLAPADEGQLQAVRSWLALQRVQ